MTVYNCLLINANEGRSIKKVQIKAFDVQQVEIELEKLREEFAKTVSFPVLSQIVSFEE